MNVKRYYAKTAREALRALKAELGADAIVLSNRAVDDGVEILALPAESVGALQQSADTAQATPRARASAQPQPHTATIATPPPLPSRHPGADIYRQASDDEDYHLTLSAAPSAATAPSLHSTRSVQTTQTAQKTVHSATAIHTSASIRPPGHDGADASRPATFRQPSRPSPLIQQAQPEITPPSAPPVGMLSEIDPAALSTSVRSSSPAPAPATAPDSESRIKIRALEETNIHLMSELSGIRHMIERQLTGFAWGQASSRSPARAEIVGELLEAGFAGPLARQLAEQVPDDETDIELARQSVRHALTRNLRALSCDADLIDRGGVYALVGTTGVGKTTTTAKIAARCVVRHGAEKLAMITTDGYRIGAQEQLRIYGRILGVPVFSVRDAADLRQTLAELRDKHMVLIDTVGVSQRDRMVAEQVAMLAGAGDVRRLLLLNTTCRGDTLEDVIDAYKGSNLAGCIFTKVDETVSLAPALGAAISHHLDVFYITNGQRVPEDLHLPNRAFLLNRALRTTREDSTWKLSHEEAAHMMAAEMGV